MGNWGNWKDLFSSAYDLKCWNGSGFTIEMESNANLTEKSSQVLEDITEDSLWEQEENSEQSSELEEFVLRIHGISELKDFPSDTW